MSEANSTTSFLIESLLENTEKKESESSLSTNHNSHKESCLSSDREHFGGQKPNNYNLNSSDCQPHSDQCSNYHKQSPYQSNYDSTFLKPHTQFHDTRYNRLPYDSCNGLYGVDHDKKESKSRQHNFYSYYSSSSSSGIRPYSYYDYMKNRSVSMATSVKDSPNYAVQESHAETTKKVVLSEESYLKLLESYRVSEELRSSMIFKKKRKQRTIFTKQQTELLGSVFNRNEYITLDERASLAKQLKISEKQVKIWFQNRRNKLKKINNSLNTTTDVEEKAQFSDDSDETEEEEVGDTTLPVCVPDD